MHRIGQYGGTTVSTTIPTGTLPTTISAPSAAAAAAAGCHRQQPADGPATEPPTAERPWVEHGTVRLLRGLLQLWVNRRSHPTISRSEAERPHEFIMQVASKRSRYKAIRIELITTSDVSHEWRHYATFFKHRLATHCPQGEPHDASRNTSPSPLSLGIPFLFDQVCWSSLAVRQ